MAKKGLIFTQDPRGCDVGLRATWQSHVTHASTCVAQCDTHTHTHTYIYIYISYYLGL